MSDFDDNTTRGVIKAIAAIRKAEAHVAPHVGPVTGTSEFGVYRAALRQLARGYAIEPAG